MAYSNGIFHIDLVSGSDAARTTLTSCVASNPAGSTTRITKTAHGLTTGAVVDLVSFSAWLNGAWKITVVDANTFDLDNAVWETTADNNGSVVPRGGSSWADAWLTIGAGATAARIQPGDKFKISKTADPVSFGVDATWTDGSASVTLASALSKKVEDAITGWTAATNITTGTNTQRKLGDTAITITPAAAFGTGKMAYNAIAGGGTQDFSAYTHINFWIRPLTANALPALTYRIMLCSDANGDTPVSVFNIPFITASTSWQPVSINLGGALSASVQSVAIWAIADPGTTAFSINNIFASDGDLTLKNLIGKSGEVHYAIQSVDDLTISIDTSNSTVPGGRGYSGATSTSTLYYRVPFEVATTATWATMSEAGNTTMQKNHYEGGWNTSTDAIDGETAICSTILGSGIALVCTDFTKTSNFIFSRFATITIANYCELANLVFNNMDQVISTTSKIDCLLTNVKILNTGTPSLPGSVIFDNCEFRSNRFYGFSSDVGQKFVGCTFANNGTSAMNMAVTTLRVGDGATILRNCVVDQTTEFSISQGRTGFLWSFDHDNTAGNHWAFTYGATINWQTTVKNTGAVGAWRLSISQSYRTIYQPVYFKLAEIAVAASSLVTVNVWVKKDHATNIAASIYVEDEAYNINGVAAMTDTKADDTSWEELTLTFTPTEAGIVPIYASAWYVAGNSDAYFGPITVTQA